MGLELCSSKPLSFAFVIGCCLKLHVYRLHGLKRCPSVSNFCGAWFVTFDPYASLYLCSSNPHRGAQREKRIHHHESYITLLKAVFKNRLARCVRFSFHGTWNCSCQVKGFATAFGNPTWKETHGKAEHTAPPVQVGKLSRTWANDYCPIMDLFAKP